MPLSKINSFLKNFTKETPYLVIDLSLVTNFYKKLKKKFPNTLIYYAVKANQAPEIIKCLKKEGSYFDVSSKKEIQLCLNESINPSRLSYGNTIKKVKDILWAYNKGVRLFAFDSEEELNKISVNAKNSRVFCRLQVPNQGANWPLSNKFGCSAEMAKKLMLCVHKKGLIPSGLSFHVGSQQTNIDRWKDALRICYEVYLYLKNNDIQIKFINIGGGFPVDYKDFKGNLDNFYNKLNREIEKVFGLSKLQVILEPGRVLVAPAGIIESEVVLVSRKSSKDKVRWVYIDIGRFGGLAETEGEAIKYKIEVVKKKNCNTAPVIIAGPTCDGADILYEKDYYQLPLNLKAGDRLRIYNTGAYTTVYTSNFNSLERLKEYFIKIT